MKKIISMLAMTSVAALAAAPVLAADTAPGSVALSAQASNTCAIGKVIGTSVGTGVAQAAASWGGGAIGDDAATFTDAAGTRSVSWGQLFDPATARVAAADFGGSNMDDLNAGRQMAEISFRAYCNYASTRIALRSQKGGMRLASLPAVAVGSTFRNAINYRAVASWGRGSGSGNDANYVNTGTTSLGGGADNGNRFGDTGGVAGGAWTTGGTSAVARNSTVNLRVGVKNGMIVPEAGYTTGASGTNQATNNDPFLAGTYTDTLTVRIGVGF
jgi:hypothetical protein